LNSPADDPPDEFEPAVPLPADAFADDLRDAPARRDVVEAPLMRLRRWGAVAAAAAGLAGCMLGPDYHAPKVATPAQFAPPTLHPPGSAKAADPPPADLQGWWRALGDKELDSLVDRAIAANLDLELALTRLQEARTQEAVVLGTALPELSLAGAGGAGTGRDVTRGKLPPGIGSADNAHGLPRGIGSVVGFDAEWEVDIFGQYRREIEAVEADAQAAAEARNAVLIAVVADVARSYIDMRGLQTQLAVLRQNIVTASRTVDVARTRFSRGLTNELDVTLAETELATLQAQEAPMAAEISAAQFTIAVLLGRYPEEIVHELARPAMIPSLPPTIAPGLPLDLLRRRPDIREAERQLAANTYRVGVATAALFPHLALVSGVGYQSNNYSSLPGKGIWSAGPATYWPLLDFGTLDALADIADLQVHASLVQYKQDILLAVEEVDTAVASYAAQQDRLGRLGVALQAAQRSVTLASQRYDRGLTDFLYVLSAEEQEYSLEAQYALAQQQAGEQLVALYRALGGGWEHYQAIPPIRTPQPAVIAAFRRVLFPEDPEK
jgi:NodT family efflux transporter outer membrane factor (OMF) lipoprotein